MEITLLMIFLTLMATIEQVCTVDMEERRNERIQVDENAKLIKINR